MGAQTYILYSAAIDSFYIGSTQDMEQRFNKHITGFYPNGFTSKAKDWVIFMRIDCETMAQARSIEAHIKRMKSRKYLHDLKQYPEIAENLVNLYKQREHPR